MRSFYSWVFAPRQEVRFAWLAYRSDLAYAGSTKLVMDVLIIGSGDLITRPRKYNAGDLNRFVRWKSTLGTHYQSAAPGKIWRKREPRYDGLRVSSRRLSCRDDEPCGCCFGFQPAVGFLGRSDLVPANPRWMIIQSHRIIRQPI